MKHIVLGLLALLLSSTLAYGDSIPCQFQMRDGSIRCGKVLSPEKLDKKTLVIFVNHRQLKAEQTQFSYSYLVDKLLADGISCCFFDNRSLHSVDFPIPSLHYSTLNAQVQKTVSRLDNYGRIVLVPVLMLCLFKFDNICRT